MRRPAVMVSPRRNAPICRFAEGRQRHVAPGGDHRVRRIWARIAVKNPSGLSEMLGKTIDFSSQRRRAKNTRVRFPAK